MARRTPPPVRRWAPRVASPQGAWQCWHPGADTIPIYFKSLNLPWNDPSVSKAFIIFPPKRLLLQHVKEAHRLPACPSSLHPLSQLLPTSSAETASVLTSPSILRKLLCHISALCHRHAMNRALHPPGLEIHSGCVSFDILLMQ